MTFTDEQQSEHRDAFIGECRQKAWGAACHADFISKSLDGLTAEYSKLKEEDDRLAADIKALETAVDYHTVENRQKRKEMQERRNGLVQVQNQLAENIRQGTQAMRQLLQNVETNLALGKHAEEWGWKELSGASAELNPPV